MKLHPISLILLLVACLTPAAVHAQSLVPHPDLSRLQQVDAIIEEAIGRKVDVPARCSRGAGR